LRQRVRKVVLLD